MEQIRSFIAIELPPEIKLELARLQDRLKENGQPRIKWVDPQGIHLTLKFLGNIDLSMVERITAAMTDAASATPVFTLDLRQPGAFPGLSRVQVVWVGLEGDLTTLDRLYCQLEEKTAASGFPPEKRDFKPHLTLARVADEALPEERKRFGVSTVRDKLPRESRLVTLVRIRKSNAKNTEKVIMPKPPI